MRHLKCFSRETSIKSSFASVKQIAFRKRNLKLETKWVEHLRIIRHLISMRTERGVGLIWGYQFVHLLICPLSHFQHIHTSVADQRSIKGYFGAPVKQLKRKAKPLTESTVVSGKKETDNPTVWVWKLTFLWVVHDANQDVMYFSICRRHSAFANLQSSLYIGCGSGGKYRIDSPGHHNMSKEQYCCSLQFNPKP